MMMRIDSQENKHMQMDFEIGFVREGDENGNNLILQQPSILNLLYTIEEWIRQNDT